MACLGLALLLVARSRQDRAAGLGFAFAGAGVLAASIAPRTSVAVLVGGALVGVVLAMLLAILYRQRPWLFPVLALACVPARVSVHVGTARSNLLVPLYVVIGGAALLLVSELWQGDRRFRELRLAAWPLAAFVAWTGISLAWSKDVQQGAIELLAFYVPFTILAVCVARLPWRTLGLRVLYLEVVAMSLVFAAVGFYQYDTRDIFQNPKVIISNAYAPFFRVNSVFWDPSVYGRFLVLAIVPSVVLVVLGRSVLLSVGALVAIALAWLGLLISFSQSSFAALLVAVVGAAFVAWRWRALAAVALAAVVLAGIGAAQPQIRRSIQHHTKSGLNSATSGRANLVANGIRIALAHPLQGVGVGGFKRAYADRVHLKGKDPKKAASHDTPVTVAAESGFVGLALLAVLVGALLRQALRPASRARTPAGILALVAGLGLAAVFVHSLFYNAFFEDPMTWGLMGLLALATSPAAAAPAEPPPAEFVVEQEEAVPA